MAPIPVKARWFLAGWRLMRADPVQTHAVAYGEVQVRVPVSVSARISAQIVALHADHGDAPPRCTLDAGQMRRPGRT